MPNNYEFTKLSNIKTVEVNPDGWVEPLYIEYGEGNMGNTPSYFWRVKGTFHTFVIPIVRMNYLSSGDYVKHFNEVLQEFRQDYIEWSKEGFRIEWMRKYEEQYKSFINL